MRTAWAVIRRALARARCPGCQPVARHGANPERHGAR